MALFCDLDGVLVDFDRGIKELTGSYSNDLTPNEMWPLVAKANSFFTNLPWMNDGEYLWLNITTYNPTILTGIPYGGWAGQQKRDWCATNLGEDISVIPCWSREKPLYGIKGDILIDDQIKAKDGWEEMGGIFIHHTSAEETLDDLEFVLG